MEAGMKIDTMLAARRLVEIADKPGLLDRISSYFPPQTAAGRARWGKIVAAFKAETLGGGSSAFKAGGRLEIRRAHDYKKRVGSFAASSRSASSEYLDHLQKGPS
jgi:hypothetical protein